MDRQDVAGGFHPVHPVHPGRDRIGLSLLVRRRLAIEVGAHHQMLVDKKILAGRLPQPGGGAFEGLAVGGQGKLEASDFGILHLKTAVQEALGGQVLEPAVLALVVYL